MHKSKVVRSGKYSSRDMEEEANTYRNVCSSGIFISQTPMPLLICSCRKWQQFQDSQSPPPQHLGKGHTHHPLALHWLLCPSWNCAVADTSACYCRDQGKRRAWTDSTIDSRWKAISQSFSFKSKSLKDPFMAEHEFLRRAGFGMFAVSVKRFVLLCSSHLPLRMSAYRFLSVQLGMTGEHTVMYLQERGHLKRALRWLS